MCTEKYVGTGLFPVDCYRDFRWEALSVISREWHYMIYFRSVTLVALF